MIEARVELLHNADEGGFKHLATVSGVVQNHDIVLLANSQAELAAEFENAVYALTWSPTLRH